MQEQGTIQQLRSAKQMMQQACTLSIVKYAHRIAFYLAVNGEMDCSFLIEWCWRHNKECYLPILHPYKAGYLQFCRYEPHDPLKVNRFGIQEPLVKSNRLLPPALLDIVFTPLVAFSETGDRLGTGGGYYDRTFAFKKNSSKRKPILNGVGYEFQKTAGININPWDVPMEWAVTDKNVYHFYR